MRRCIALLFTKKLVARCIKLIDERLKMARFANAWQIVCFRRSFWNHCIAKKDLTLHKTANLTLTIQLEIVHSTSFFIRWSKKGYLFFHHNKAVGDGGGDDSAMTDIKFIQSRQVIFNSGKPSSDIACLNGINFDICHHLVQ